MSDASIHACMARAFLRRVKAEHSAVKLIAASTGISEIFCTSSNAHHCGHYLVIVGWEQRLVAPHERQILDSVVLLVAVEMVDNVTGWDGSVGLLPDSAMLELVADGGVRVEDGDDAGHQLQLAQPAQDREARPPARITAANAMVAITAAARRRTRCRRSAPR